ncbi:MAG TPA: amidase [Gaiellaceae bacterium]|nr:amidase [Gaiellaceae bacterium]
MTDDLSIAELGARLRGRQLSPLDLIRASLERIEADRALNAYVTVTATAALESARRAEAELRSGRSRGPLHGLPAAVKDNIDTAGVPTTGGTPSLRDRVPSQDASVWGRLREAGAVLVGKTGLHELAYRAPHPAFGAARNPYDAARAPGGSSSGSAVAVAAGHAVAALGTDTGGSVRQPAAFCGVVGIKPGRSVLPRDGVIPLSRSLDAVGVIARDPEDARTVLAALAPLASDTRRPLRIGVVAEDQAMAPAIHRAIVSAAGRLAAGGHRTLPAALPPLERLRTLHRTILLAEAYTEHHALLDRTGPLFQQAVGRGASIGGAELARALRERDALRPEALLGEADALLLPTAPDVAPLIDAATGRAAADTDLNRWTFLASLFDLPAISVPAGEHEGLPLAVQLVGRPGGEGALLDLAREAFMPSRRPVAA